ncbi:unnamed protein product [Acanthosepion pharaonis]|uniref:Major facilitator superfamily (MFS) profile domain-containing protein n=1 Tax=Acanthosepion pharaonis TaxID=158019 RepID=A0A812BFN7_ACAPH|nr:unnamed protein product [Sepia pharaonis]
MTFFKAKTFFIYFILFFYQNYLLEESLKSPTSNHSLTKSAATTTSVSILNVAKPGTKSKFTCHEWMLMLVTSMNLFMMMGFLGCMGILYVELLQEFHSSKSVMSAIVALPWGMAFGSGFIAGILINRINCGLVLIFGSLVMAGSIIASSFATGVVYLTLTLGIFMGFGGSFIFVASYIGTGLYFGERGQYAIATVSLGVPLGFLVYPLLMTSLIQLFMWRGALLILGGLALNGIPFGAIIWLASSAKKAKIERGIISNLGSQKASMKTSVTSIGRIHSTAFSSTVDLDEGDSTLRLCREILHNKNFVLILCCLSLLMSSVTMIFNTLSDFCIELGLTKMDSAFLLTLFNIPSLCGRFITSLLLRFTKIPSPYIFVVTLSLFGAILATLPLATNFVTSTVIILFSGLMQGPCTGIYTCVIIKLVGLNRSALAQGISDTTYGIITIVVGYLGGHWIDHCS